LRVLEKFVEVRVSHALLGQSHHATAVVRLLVIVIVAVFVLLAEDVPQTFGHQGIGSNMLQNQFYKEI
jgi:hypothetical protein